MLKSENLEWVKEQIAKHGNLYPASITKLKLVEAYRERFGKDVSKWTIKSWANKVQYGDGVRKVTKGKKKESQMIGLFEKANYLLYVFPDGFFGFDTKDEVRDYLSKNAITSPLRLFENIKAEVKTTIQVEL